MPKRKRKRPKDTRKRPAVNVDFGVEGYDRIFLLAQSEGISMAAFVRNATNLVVRVRLSDLHENFVTEEQKKRDAELDAELARLEEGYRYCIGLLGPGFSNAIPTRD